MATTVLNMLLHLVLKGFNVLDDAAGAAAAINGS